nr:GntR family transcriptional regulator [Candidatus Pantoea persica]
MAMSLPRRLAWLAWAQRHDSWIIEDDYDSEFHYDDRPPPAMQGLDRHGRVITLGTFSKSLFPSLRLAWMVVPPALVEPLGQARSVMDGHSALQQQGHFASHLRLMRQLYRSRPRSAAGAAATYLALADAGGHARRPAADGAAESG